MTRLAPLRRMTAPLGKLARFTVRGETLTMPVPVPTKYNFGQTEKNIWQAMKLRALNSDNPGIQEERNGVKGWAFEATLTGIVRDLWNTLPSRDVTATATTMNKRGRDSGNFICIVVAKGRGKDSVWWVPDEYGSGVPEPYVKQAKEPATPASESPVAARLAASRQSAAAKPVSPSKTKPAPAAPKPAAKVAAPASEVKPPVKVEAPEPEPVAEAAMQESTPAASGETRALGPVEVAALEAKPETVTEARESEPVPGPELEPKAEVAEPENAEVRLEDMALPAALTAPTMELAHLARHSPALAATEVARLTNGQLQAVAIQLIVDCMELRRENERLRKVTVSALGF